MIGKKIKRKTAEVLKGLEEEDLFGVSIEDCNSSDVCTEENKDISPGDDGYGDDEEATIPKI